MPPAIISCWAASRAVGRAGQGRAGQGRAGQGRAGQGRAGQGIVKIVHIALYLCRPSLGPKL